MINKSSFFFLFALTINCKILLATTYTVNTNSDALTGFGSSGSLRYCITQANLDPATPHLIQFNIAASGVQTITLLSSLPTLTRSNVTIDGYTEPGAAMGTFATRVFTVVIDASSIGVGGYPFRIEASDVLFRGFSIISTRTSGSAFMSIGRQMGTLAQNTHSNVKFQGNIINLTPTGDALIPTPAGAAGGAVHVFGVVDGTTKLSSGKNVVIGTDGDGIDDDKEGNMGVPCTTGTSFFGIRDVDNCVVAGNWIGIKPDGTTLVNYLPAGNASLANYPIYLGNCFNTRIGTNGDGVSDAFERNVLADGNRAVFMAYNYTTGTNPSLSVQPLRAPGNNQVTGNYLGTDAGGNTATGRINGASIAIRGNGNFIGCNLSETTNATFRNIISAMNSASCIWEVPHDGVNWNSVSNVFKGNYIGIGANGTSALTGGWGILHYNAINSKNIGNVIGNMGTYGVYLYSNTLSSINNSGLIIADNFIGLQADGISPAPNTQDNIYVRNAEGISIQNNIIANSLNGSGVAVLGGATPGLKTQGVNISQNSFYNNATLPIDLWPVAGSGVSGNDDVKDPASSITSPNLMMDYPVILSADISGTNFNLTGYVGASPSNPLFANCRIEFYIADNSPANQNGEMILGDGLSLPHGEGRTYLGFLTTDAGGNFSGVIDITGKGVSAASIITATATDNAGNTSEFSTNYTSVVTPLRLISFSANCKNVQSIINWETSDEKEIVFYDVEHSQNGINWVRLTSISPKQNSTFNNIYKFVHKGLLTTQNLYRIKSVNLDGRFNYSNVLQSNCDLPNVAKINIYPNPAGEQLNIVLQGNSQNNSYELIDALGRVLLIGNLTVNSNTRVDVTALASGTYTIRIRTDTKVVTEKVQIVK